jgi:hypothetical protein
MGPLAILLIAAIGYAVWSGKVKLAQLPPIVLALAGAFIALRGSWILGAAAVAVGVAWYRGLTWRLFGLKSKQSDEFALSKARWLLGVSANDGEDRIRARHRELMTQNHPDIGGNEERAQQLNEARDLLLDDLARKTV